MNENPNPNQYPQTQQPQPPPPPHPVQVAVPYVKPHVTYAILGFTFFIYLLQLAGLYLLPATLTNSWIAATGTSDIAAILGEKVNGLIRAGQLWRLITPVFLHDSSLALRALAHRFQHVRPLPVWTRVGIALRP